MAQDERYGLPKEHNRFATSRTAPNNITGSATAFGALWRQVRGFLCTPAQAGRAWIFLNFESMRMGTSDKCQIGGM